MAFYGRCWRGHAPAASEGAGILHDVHGQALAELGSGVQGSGGAASSGMGQRAGKGP